MQQKNGTLRVHTSIIPNEKEAEAPPPKRLRWKSIPYDKKLNAGMGTAKRIHSRIKRPRRASGRKLTLGETLLRNTAIACSLLLVLLALNSVDQPWSQQAADSVRRVVSMRIDLDETLGKLNFVRDIMPDSALVFWNMGNQAKAVNPVVGAVEHAFDTNQPYLIYKCNGVQDVCSIADGQVTAVAQGSQSDWTVLVDHADGVQTVYAYLSDVTVKVGQQIAAGGPIGRTFDGDASKLYFEYRKNGIAQNPEGA